MSHYEKGDYRAKVLSQGFAESKAKNTPYFFLQIEPIEAKGVAVLPEKRFPRTIEWYFTDNTKDFTIEKLRRLGWDGSKLAELEPGAPNHHSFVGDVIDVYNVPDEKGYDKFELAREGSAPSNGPTGIPGIAAKLDRLWGKSLTATAAPKKNGAKKHPAQEMSATAAGGEVPEDEIPF